MTFLRRLFLRRPRAFPYTDLQIRLMAVGMAKAGGR